MNLADGIGLLVTLVFTVGTLGVALLVTVVSVALPLGILFVVFRTLAKNAAAERELLATGTAAPARILSVGQTGMYVNNQPQVQILLEVSPPDGPVFRASVNKVISMLQIPQVQPGVLVDVRYDPRNPSRLAVVGL